MKSANEIKKLAKKLSNASIDDGGRVDKDKVMKILSLVHTNKLGEIGINVEETQIVTLLKEYYKLLKNALIEDTIKVTTAVSLTNHEMEDKEKKLKEAFGRNKLIFEVEKDIIAGLKIQAGWNIIDDSVKNKLDTLKF